MKKGFILIAVLLLVSCMSCNNPTPGTSSIISGDSKTGETTPSETSEESKSEEITNDKTGYDNPYKDDDDWHRIG